MSFERIYILIVSVLLFVLVIRRLIDYVRHRLTMKALLETNDLLRIESSLDCKIKESLDRLIYYFNESNEISNLKSLLTQEAFQILEKKIADSSSDKSQCKIMESENELKKVLSNEGRYRIYFDSYDKDSDILTGRIFFDYHYKKILFLTVIVPAITSQNNNFETICLSEGIRFQCKTNPTVMIHRIERIERDVLLKLQGSASIFK